MTIDHDTLDAHVLACPVCGQPHRMPASLPDGGVADCARCGAQIARQHDDSLHRTAALAVAALLLYVPGNLFPLLILHQSGVRTETTVFGSSRLLYEHGDYLIALVVFLASVLIPLVKLVGLVTLSVTTALGTRVAMRARTRLYLVIHGIGKWAMLDVFALALLVSAVKLQGLANVNAGVGALPFAMVVVLTQFATSSFDPQLIWTNGAKSLLERRDRRDPREKRTA